MPQTCSPILGPLPSAGLIASEIKIALVLTSVEWEPCVPWWPAGRNVSEQKLVCTPVTARRNPTHNTVQWGAVDTRSGSVRGLL